ncbi:MAG: hypothetical protein R2857_13820 [Vampirovibrionales bacterium]
MVDPIQPINPANTPVPSVNPAQAYPPAPITQTPATTPTTTPATTNIQSTTSAIQSPLTIAQDLSIDFAAMGSNQQYFLGTLDLILAKARQYYRAFDYTTAAQYYDSFFSYFRKFALSYPSLGAWSNNFGAFYEMTITNYYLNRQNEADTFLNQVLEMALETGKRNMADEIRNSLNRGMDTAEQTFFKQLTQLQRDGELPVSGQLNVQINPGLLQQLAVQANAKPGRWPLFIWVCPDLSGRGAVRNPATGLCPVASTNATATKSPANPPLRTAFVALWLQSYRPALCLSALHPSSSGCIDEPTDDEEVVTKPTRLPPWEATRTRTRNGESADAWSTTVGGEN